MTLALRRLAATGVLAVCSVFGAAVGVAVAAPAASPSATPSSSATADAGDDVSVSEDIAPDNSRMIWVLGGAGAVALVAGAVVIARP